MRAWGNSDNFYYLFEDIPDSDQNSEPPSIEVYSNLAACNSKIDCFIGEKTTELFEFALNPDNPVEICTLAIGRTEYQLGIKGIRSNHAARWKNRKKHRSITQEELLDNPAYVDSVRQLFNFFFKDDLYGALEDDENIILSSGSFDEGLFVLPETLKSCISYALNQNWYGYSHSNGREQTREALAYLETIRSNNSIDYDFQNVAVTLGGTSAISTIVDCISSGEQLVKPKAICAIPNYPPLISAISKRFDVELFPTEISGGNVHIDRLIENVEQKQPRLVLIQPSVNPSGSQVSEDDLEKLIKSAHKNTYIILDESHECFGPPNTLSSARGATNVIRLRSFSKMMAAPGLKVGWIISSKDFINDFYERSSVSYGGPVSLFYLFIEIYARFESWRLQRRAELNENDLSFFETQYNLNLGNLNKAYASYIKDRTDIDNLVLKRRYEAVGKLQNLGWKVLIPRNSINIMFQPPGSCSYTTFRKILSETKVAFYPGELAFCSEGNWLRLSPCVNEQALSEAFERLSLYKEINLRDKEVTPNYEELLNY